ncbi:MAG: ABC transporter permease, partial [Bryobacteraceae bacterium]
MESFLHDVRFGIRILLRTPAITASILIILAIGIGATSAMFGAADRLLLHPITYPDPSTLVFVWNYDAQGVLGGAAAANFLDWRAQAKTLTDFAVWVPTNFVLTGGDRPRQLAGARVTSNFFHTLGIRPVLGRAFLPDEDGLDNPASAANSVVISYHLWQEDLGSDPNVLGRTIRVDSIPYAIVGVMPPDFQFWWRPSNIWVPVNMWVPVKLNKQDRDYHNLGTIARLKAPRASAEAEMAVIARSLEQAYPTSNKGWTIRVEDFQDYLLNRTFRTRFLILMGAVGMVLLIGCANIAGLLLARSAARTQEIAVRISLGATGARLAQQLLTESAVLSLLGGALGLVLAWGLIHIAPSIVPPTALPGGTIELNARVVGFTALISILTSLMFGLTPAIAAMRPDIQTALKGSGRSSTGGRKQQRLRQLMVAAEVAVALMVLAGAGLMIESFRNLVQIDPGFNPKNVLTLRLFLPAAKFDSAQALRFQRLALQRIATLPGVKTVTMGSALPLLNSMEVPFDLESAPPRGPGERPGVPYVGIGPDYFRTLSIPLKGGRDFTETDNETAPPVAIVNQALVARYFADQDPIGKRILVNRPMRGRSGFSETERLEIVGIAGNVRISDVATESSPVIYVPQAQNAWSSTVWFAARTESDPSALNSAVRAELSAIDRDQPIEQAGSLEQMLTDQFAQPRFQT